MPSARIWFTRLQDVAHDTEAFMDELSYEVTRRNVEKHRKVREFFIPSKNSLVYRFKVARKIKSIHASYDDIFKLAGDIGLRPAQHSTVQPRVIRNKPPYEDTPFIVGRDNNISNLVQTVCQNNQQDLHVVAIIGMGGQGKTTLASMVFHSDDIIMMFTKRMWINVSDDFNYVNILNQMLQALTSENAGLDNIQGLVNKLQKEINGEKYLLVLDDVWNEASEKWDDLRKSLLGIGGAKGSSVIVTTRKQEVIYAMRNCVSHQLEKLQEDDSYELFKKIAFGDGGVPEKMPFVDLGRRMVQRCGGLPLAIKALGGMLRYKDSEQEWRKIENSEIWTSKDVLSSLRLSYDHLPYPSLKRCFVYCSVIPKDTLIDRDELIQIWMALGFLLPPLGSDERMEDIGIKFFDILLWHSLLQDIKRDKLGNIASCKMHDLVHDLALDLSQHHSVTVKTGLELNHVSKATYLRLDKRVSDRSLQILKTGFGQVRSLHAGEDVFHDVLPYITHLTVLVLNSDGSGLMNVAELPELLRYMKYVKHLDISCLRCKVSGYNITELYNLQTLRVWDLEEHPQMFYKLINLRHLYIKKYLPSRCMFNRIERLTCLQTLPHFIVSKDQNCGIEQLEGLHNLGGEVKLYGLGDVRNRQEARKAKLPTKSNIESLLLNWKTDEDESANYSEQESVLEGLEPHTNTKELIIEYFMGKRLASWITKMINLVEIRFSECQRCEEFPSLGHLPKLRKMKLEKLYNLRIIGSHVGLASNGGAAENVTTMYPSLTELRLWHLPKLEEWVEPDMSRDHISVQVFPKLAVLFMHSCPNLSWMPDSCFPSLKELTITNSKMIPEAMSTKVSSLRSVRFRDMHISDPVVEELLKNSSQSLRSLDLSYCLGLTRLTFGIALEELSVWDLPNLTSIHAVKDETLSLRALCIVKCSSLSEYPKSVSSIIERLQVDKISHVNNIGTSFPVLTTLKLTEFERSRLEFDDHHVLALPAVTQLEILHCTELKAIPDAIADLPSLQLLSIRNCELVESLPTFHPSHSIQRLEMKSCGALYPGYSTKTAAERYKIGHIPIIKWRW
nr:PREDICTED: putative disease resistance protein RGA4 [Daucus carota subsp. sativus]